MFINKIYTSTGADIQGKWKWDFQKTDNEIIIEIFESQRLIVFL